MTDTSLQPLPVTIVPNTPTQLPAYAQGCTIINDLTAVLELCSDQNFTTPVLLPVGASLPWSTGTTLWAQSTVGGTIKILPQTYNYYNPNTISVPSSPSPILSEVFQGLGPFTGEVIVTPPANTRTLFIEILGGSPQVIVEGTQSGYPFLFNDPALANLRPAYLYTAAGNGLFVVPITMAMDSTITIQYSFGGNLPSYINVYADTLKYEESDFYNGVPTSGGVAYLNSGSSTLVNGPCRLISAQMAVQQGSGTGYSQSQLHFISGNNIMQLNSPYGGVGNPLTFPQPFIVPIEDGIVLSWSAGGPIQAQVITAYP